MINEIGLYGGEDSDTPNGGAGADSFILNTALGSKNAPNVDTVADFVSGTDTIILENAIFTTLGEGALSAGAFEVGATAGSASTRIVYNQTTGALFYDADGSGGGAAVQIAIIGATTHPTLTAGDFNVI